MRNAAWWPLLSGLYSGNYSIHGSFSLEYGTDLPSIFKRQDTMESERSRAGTYITQPTGYRAFSPKPLPPDPAVRLQGELQTLLSRSDRALGRLDGSIHTLPNPNLFTYMYVRKEAVLSSQIEGTQSSLHDVLAAEANLRPPERPQDVGEVVNYVKAMNHGLALLGELPVSLRLIKEIHAKLLEGARGSHLTPGDTRRTQNWIGPQGSSLANALFIPPPPHELGKHLGELEGFLHGTDDLPLLIKIGLAHAQFETIHPFLDGNGRVGRLLITFLMCEAKVLGKPVLYLSYYFKEHRQEYYEQLQSIRDRGTWEEWLKFFLRGVIVVADQATETARRVLSLREDHRRRMTDKLGRAAANGHRVLEYLYEHPIVSVNEVQNLTRTTYQAANDLVARMSEERVLVEVTGQVRNRRFLYSEYIALFSSSDDEQSAQ